MFFVWQRVPLPVPPVARPAFITVALLLLDIDTPSVTLLLLLLLPRLPWGFFRALEAFPASKIEGKP
jgi:hypothetical protein